MLPRWFRAVAAAELIAVIALAVIGVHLGRAGAQAAGDVISWGRQQAGVATPQAHASPWILPAPPSPRAGVAPALGRLGGPLLQRLDSDTALTARGEWSLVQQLEAMLRDRITAVLDQVGSH